MKDIEKALVENEGYIDQLYTIFQLAIREYIGGMTLDHLLSKHKIGPYLIDRVGDSVESLGVIVLSGGIKDIILPGDIREIMNRVLIAEKNAKATVNMRHEETASTRSLLNTAKLMEKNAILL